MDGPHGWLMPQPADAVGAHSGIPGPYLVKEVGQFFRILEWTGTTMEALVVPELWQCLGLHCWPSVPGAEGTSYRRGQTNPTLGRADWGSFTQ